MGNMMGLSSRVLEYDHIPRNGIIQQESQKYRILRFRL